MKLSHGDAVIVISGKDKGKKGTVLRVLRDQNRVIVGGVNMITKHVKKTPQGPGRKLQYEVSISASNVMILDPKTGKPTRVGYKLEGGKKIRIARKSGAVITRVKVESETKGVATKASKAPFWKKAGFGADAAASGDAPKPESAPVKATVSPTRSGGRGS